MGCLSDVIFIAIEDNLGYALSRSHAQKAANFVLKGELEVSGGENQGWPEDID